MEQIYTAIANVLAILGCGAGAVVYVDKKISSIRDDWDARWERMKDIIDNT
jgi:hypothetical protein